MKRKHNKGDKSNQEMKCDETYKEWVTEYGKCPETEKRQNPLLRQ